MCTALKLQSFVLYRKMLDKNNSSVKILQVNILLPLLDIAFFFFWTEKSQVCNIHEIKERFHENLKIENPWNLATIYYSVFLWIRKQYEKLS